MQVCFPHILPLSSLTYARLRKIKCDETWPECKRCTNTNRACDGYSPTPAGSFSWDVLLRAAQPRLLPVTDPCEVRGLSFFHHAVAPFLSGPYDGSFWTYLVAQMTHSEPAVRHAVLAISSLFESYGLSSNAEPTVNRFAVLHYNRAINILVNHTAPSIDLVLPVCVLFICIEFLRGNSEAAVIHASHGVELYNATADDSRLSTILSQMSIFPLFFVQGGEEFPLLRREINSTAKGSPEFFNMSEAQSIFGNLCVESLRITRAVNSYQFSTDQNPSEELIAMQREAEQDIEAWGNAFDKFQATRPDTDREDSTGLALMLWYKLIKLWLSECQEPSEIEDDALRDDVISWVRKTAENLKTPQIKPAEFIYSTGFNLMLHFTINRCRYRPLRIEALSLMRKLSSENDAGLDEPLGIEHDSDLSGENNINDETLSPGQGRSWKSVMLRKEFQRKNTKDANRRNLLWSYRHIANIHE
jgi:hypothetical protein